MLDQPWLEKAVLGLSSLEMARRWKSFRNHRRNLRASPSGLGRLGGPLGPLPSLRPPSALPPPRQLSERHRRLWWVCGVRLAAGQF
eukprot:2328060-Pyramimonas_sp.AAC.1